MSTVELQDGFNLHAAGKVFWLSREFGGWTREQVSQVCTIVHDCVRILESELDDTNSERQDLNRECDEMRTEVDELRYQLDALKDGAHD